MSACDNCGLEVCHNCNAGERLITHFPHSVYCSGSGDADYCPACIALLREKGDPRLFAYLRIQALRAQAQEDALAFRSRVDAAEAEVKQYAIA